MKKKIGEIYNKPIVTGDKNLVTKNEIHESTLNGGGTVDSSSSDVEYYATDMERLNLLGENGLNLLMIFSLFKYEFKPHADSIGKHIDGGWLFYNNFTSGSGSVWLHGIAFSKIKYNSDEINTLKEAVVYYNLDISLFDSVFTPITKEEFYDLNNV